MRLVLEKTCRMHICIEKKDETGRFLWLCKQEVVCSPFCDWSTLIHINPQFSGNFRTFSHCNSSQADYFTPYGPNVTVSEKSRELHELSIKGKWLLLRPLLSTFYFQTVQLLYDNERLAQKAQMCPGPLCSQLLNYGFCHFVRFPVHRHKRS